MRSARLLWMGARMTDRLLVDPNNPLCIQLNDGKELPWDWIDAERGVASEDDVREIVRRWNCHEDMREALIEARQWAHIMVVTKTAPEMNEFREKLDAIIAKAESRLACDSVKIEVGDV